MRKQKVYLETTMFNYYFDQTKNAQPSTVAFFEAEVIDYEIDD